MWVFFVLILVPLMMQNFSARKSHFDYKKKNKDSLTVFFILYTLLVMLRHKTVGNDTINYIHFFKSYSQMNWGTIERITVEVGFAYFNKIVSIFTKDPQIFLAITAILTIALIYPTYRRLCVDSSLTIILFCIMSTFVMPFSGIRQMLAIGVGVLAYEFTRNKKIIPFIVSIFFAISFHTSAFMLAFMYPLYHAKITKKWLFSLLPAIILVFIFNEQIFFFLSNIVSRFTKYEGEISSTGAYTMLLLFIAFTVFSFLIPDESLLDKEVIGLRNFLLFALLLQMFAPLHTLAMRMGYYYIIFIPLLIPKIIEKTSKTWNQVAVAGRHVMVVFFLIYFFIVAYNGGALNVFPYHFFWETI